MKRTHLHGRRSRAFRPRVERLESRNAPGDVLSLTLFALGGLGFLGDEPSRDAGVAEVPADTPAGSASPARPRRESGDALSRFTPPAPPEAPSAPALADVRETQTRDALADAAAVVLPFTEDGEFFPSRRDRLGMRWSAELEEALRQSFYGSYLPPDVNAGGAGTRGGGLAAVAALTPGRGFVPFSLLTSLKVQITGDTDRDGFVTDTDLPGRHDWTRDRGAIYAVNFDDDDTNIQPDAVDWNDQGRPFNENTVVENAEDVRDLAVVRIGPFGPGLTPDTRVYLVAGSAEDAESIHVFPYLAPGAQAVLGGVGTRAGGPATAREADVTAWVSPTSEVYFGVEGLLFRNTGTDPALRFDGTVDLTVEVRAGTTVLGRDAARLKVAPWVMSHHMEPTAEAWVGDFGTINAPYRRTASAEPGYVGLDHSGQLREVTGSDRGTQWFQDHGEFGYTGFPGGPRTTAFFRVPYFRGLGVPQPAWPKTRLLRPDVGTFQLGVNLGAGAGDYGGNLEMTHPTPAHPLGRIILGSTGSAALFTFLESQEVQQPFRLDTHWLIVSHLDETFMFTHNANQVVVADPAQAYDLMEAIPAEERGRAVLFATGADPVSGTAPQDGEPTRIYTGIDHTKGPRWGWVRVYDSSATGSNAAGQIARVAPGGLQNGYLVVSQVYNSTSTIIGPRGGNHHMEWALERDIPFAAAWFATPRAGDRFVLIEETRQWASPFNNAPAAVTVHEVLNDPNFRALNLTDVRGRIGPAMAALEQAVGGPGTLQFVSVPTLFLGRRLGGGGVEARTGVAFTAGLANVVPIAGNLYFPRQFGYRDTQGRDVFEQVTRAALPDAQFVDDWDIYHRLLGEVHCGVVVRSDPVDPSWWYYQP